MMNEFNIGDRIQVKEYEDLPAKSRYAAIGKIAGKCGEVIDKLYSESNGCYIYRVQLDNYEVASKCDFTGDMLDYEYVESVTYRHEFEYLDNVVVVRMYEVIGDEATLLGRGHGHILHDGAYGIAQASSWACKVLAENLNGGSLRRRDEV